MKKILLLFIMLIPLCLLSTETYIPPGPVSGTWTLANSPYLIEGEIYIENNEMLIIEAGVEVRFLGWYKLVVYGSLIADGDPESMIRFSSNSPAAYRWHGIRFLNNTLPSLLNNCIVEYGETILSQGSSPDNCGGGIMILNSNNKITIANSIIRNNEAWYGGGISILRASPTIENCEITHNTAAVGGGIDGRTAGTPFISNCLIKYNSAGYGGGISMLSISPLLEFNELKYNVATYNGGGLYLSSVENYEMKKNIVAFNSANIGGAVYMLNVDGAIDANTFCYNDALDLGGGFYISSSSPHLRSNVVYFNSAFDGHQFYLATTDSDPDFEHCNIRGGLLGFSGSGAGDNFTGLWDHCIDGDPLFNNPFQGDFSITWENYPEVDNTRSPCIDAGCPGIFTEPDGTCCDIGANCYLQLIDVPQGLHSYVTPGTMTFFVAGWEPAYGALKYSLEVAKDETFRKIVLEIKNIEGVYAPITLPVPFTYCYFRVQAHNSAVVSAKSNPNLVELNPHQLKENEKTEINIYANSFGVQVELGKDAQENGDIWIYNLAGQLIAREVLNPGMNTINYLGDEQILLVKVLYEDKVTQKKLLVY